MRPPSPSIPEREFLFSALKESLRLDGRSPLEVRTPTLTFGPELGWVECALGKTRSIHLFTLQSEPFLIDIRVLAQVDAKMVKPQPERPFEGSITIHSEISPMASSDYEPGR
jgi:exosome complex component RRP45